MMTDDARPVLIEHPGVRAIHADVDEQHLTDGEEGA